MKLLSLAGVLVGLWLGSATAAAAAQTYSYGDVSVVENSPVGLCDTVKQYSGYITVNNTKNLFFWFFESRSNPSNDPFILWMTGGPGCSSLLALFYENGPCQIANDLNTTINPYSWNSQANILYIDQPVGTGFSYGYPLDHSEAQVAPDVYNFLIGFFKEHSEYSNLNFFVTGESYGGHYVPAVSHYIWQQNNGNPPIKIQLSGIAIGNGLTDPPIQYRYYAEMAWNNSVGHVVSEPVYDAMRLATPECVALIELCQALTIECTIAQEFCNLALIAPVEATGVNLYNLKEKCTYPPLCSDFTPLTKFLEQPHVTAELGTTGHNWNGPCNYEVNLLFTTDWMKNYETQIPDLLSSNIPVLIYAGELDYICNYRGNFAWTLAMPWSGQQNYVSAPMNDWIVNGTAAGTYKTANGFTFVGVYNAGHMVPMDQPANALALINTFITGGSF